MIIMLKHIELFYKKHEVNILLNVLLIYFDYILTN